MLHGASLLKSNKVPFSGYFMTGFPGETDEDLQQTIDFANLSNFVALLGSGIKSNQIY